LNESGGKKRKTLKAEILPEIEVPKILPYKNLMPFLKTTDATTYFSYLQMSQSNKHTMFGCIGGSDATCHGAMELAKRVQSFKKCIKNPNKKQRSENTKFITQNKSR